MHFVLWCSENLRRYVGNTLSSFSGVMTKLISRNTVTWLHWTGKVRSSAHGIEIKEPSAHDITKIFTKVSNSKFEIWSHPEKNIYWKIWGVVISWQPHHCHQIKPNINIIPLASPRLTPTLRWFLPRSPRPSPHIKTTSQQWTFRSMKVAWNWLEKCWIWVLNDPRQFWYSLCFDIESVKNMKKQEMTLY